MIKNLEEVKNNDKKSDTTKVIKSQGQPNNLKKNTHLFYTAQGVNKCKNKNVEYVI